MPIIESAPRSTYAPRLQALRLPRGYSPVQLSAWKWVLTFGFRPRGASIVAASTGPVIRTVQRSKTQSQSLPRASISVEATKFLTYVRTVNATLNDPINNAINA